MGDVFPDRHPPVRQEDLSRHGAWPDPPREAGDDGEKRTSVSRAALSLMPVRTSRAMTPECEARQWLNQLILHHYIQLRSWDMMINFETVLEINQINGICPIIHIL